MGVTIPCFRQSGILPSRRILFAIVEITSDTRGSACLRCSADIWVISDALLFLSPAMVFVMECEKVGLRVFAPVLGRYDRIRCFSWMCSEWSNVGFSVGVARCLK